MDRRAFVLGASHAALAVAALAATKEAALAQRTAEDVPVGAQGHFAQVNGVRLHYIAMGSGPLVVLLHGWPQTSFSWHGVMPRLASTHTVIAPDLRGTGRSQITEGGYDKRTIAEDIRALIAHTGASGAHVVGHDMGGKAAYVLAHLHPEIVTKLVLADCLVPGTENMDALRGGAWHYGFHMASGIPEMLTAGRERAYIAAQIRAWSRRKDAITEAAIDEYVRHYAQPGGMTAGFNYYRALHEDAEITAAFGNRKLAMPVLAITGRYGVGDKLAASLRDRIQNLNSVVLEDSGHFVAEESPHAFCDALERFLAA